MPAWTRWALGLGIVFALLAVPFFHFRSVYAYGKRLRVVRPGVLYRSGQMTAAGFEDVVRRYHIRTVINLQNEFPDPDINRTYLDRSQVKESDLCAQLGVRYLFLPPDLISKRRVPAERPEAIERFLAIMDDPANQPVLIHCLAGLHRTGCMAAVYRMEYEGWTPQEAIAELKDVGFGEFACDDSNDYIVQYILTYRRGQRATRNVD